MCVTTSSRAERFVALDQQLETALKDADDRPTSVVIGDAEPVNLSVDSLKTLRKLVQVSPRAAIRC